MKKISVSFQYDDEKIATLKMYLAEKNMDLTSELEKFIDGLYTKNIPVQVRDYLKMKSGEPVAKSEPKKKPTSNKPPQKPSSGETQGQNGHFEKK